MQKWKTMCIMLMLAVNQVSAQESYDSRVRAYIEKYKEWAIAEQKRSGVPAAITLAQGIHETSAGNSELALNANNHFGIKCKKEWNGETYKYTDDAPDECFRKYPSALHSYKDHSDYLAGSKRYAALFQLSATDYTGWAHGLKRAGYATNPKYAQMLIKLVEAYRLQDYTLAALKGDFNPVREAENEHPLAGPSGVGGEVVPDEDARPALMAQATLPEAGMHSQPKARKSSMSVSYGSEAQAEKKTEQEPQIEYPTSFEYGKLIRVNGLRAFYAKKGTVLLEDAFKHNIRYARLLEINELPDLPLEADMLIYLDKKNTKGIHETHIVKPGETLIQIAQAEAMQLRYLKYYNRIAANEEPVEGAVLRLRQYSEEKPATYVKNFAPKEESRLAFVGASPKAIPQGATRMRAGYISKKEIREASKEPIGTKQVPNAAPVAESSPAPVGTEPQASPETDDPNAEIHQDVPSAEVDQPVAAAPAAEVTQAGAVPTEEPASEKKTPALVDVPSATKPLIAEPMTSAEPVAVAEVSAPEAPAKADEHEPAPEAAEATATEATAAVVIASQAADATVAAAQQAEVPAAQGGAPDFDIIQPEPVVEIKNNDAAAPAQPEAVATEAPKQETIPSLAPVQGTAPEPAAIAAAPAPEKREVPALPEEPKDEFDRLKAKLDKVVYASDQTVPQAKPEEKKVVQPLAEPKKAAPVALKESADNLYTVKKGDTAFGIAKKHNITMRQLMDWNKLDFKTVKAGQKLKVKP